MKHTKLFFIVAMVMSTTLLHAQIIKSVTLSPDTAYTEQLSLKAGNKDMDIALKLAFDETKNTLTVSINASKMVFVFWANVKYKHIIHNRWLHPDKLPYIVSCHPQDRFRFTKESHHRIHKPFKHYQFKNWIEVNGLQAIDNELKMVNENLEQAYNIHGQSIFITIRLRDILLMEQGRQRGMGHDYDLIYGKDINTEYQITLKRNPCFGLDNDIKVAQNNLTNIRKSYNIFRKKYGKGTVNSQDELDAFNDLQETLIAKYPKENLPSVCPEIQNAHNKYNAFVDSILNASVTLQSTPADAMAAIGGAEGRVLNAKSILANTRLLDGLVSHWLISKDEAERGDLDEQCRSIIKETSTMIGNRTGQTPEERNAVALFHKAVQYYKRTCK